MEVEGLDAFPPAGALDATGAEGETPGADGFVAGADPAGMDDPGVWFATGQ